MSHPPAAARALLASALSVTALPATAGCSIEGEPRPRWFSASASAAASPAVEQPAGSGAALTEAQAQAALITAADLGEPWGPTRGARTWRDGLLKATTEDRECQRLLDALYTEEVFGAPRGPHATSAFDDADSDAQVRYQIAAHPPADVDRTLDWLKSLPGRCGQFTAATTRGGVQGVEVRDLPLPPVGDARQALRVTLAGETEDGELTYLTMDLAAARVGEETVVLTHAGLGEVYAEVTQQAVRLGAERLTEIRKQARAQI
ncbi:hypothetical protein [Streptomyces lomondensis]|uniref:Secreted protein n=1 Tax=Streptomyces lomondensis TaxID=68229 RepID=A0ABQ2XGG1_9ACTN|nr:hypothetical protein [Streptomyces lomondensis]MCF0077502.1 hypothetical protein [Streptomyces lomondensis]GGX14726.1 hypothetical protein GCM10010383_51150 [Streptomyces lomondensis]